MKTQWLLLSLYKIRGFFFFVLFVFCSRFSIMIDLQMVVQTYGLVSTKNRILWKFYSKCIKMLLSIIFWCITWLLWKYSSKSTDETVMFMHVFIAWRLVIIIYVLSLLTCFFFHGWCPLANDDKDQEYENWPYYF